MISIVYCTREHNPEHTEHLRKTSGLHKHAQIIEIINNGESLTKCYNRGLKQAEHDIVVFCHDDITIETGSWAKKLIKHYEKNPEYAILGVAGTKHLTPSGRWWDDKRAMYGRVQHTHEGKTWLSKYSDDQGTRIEEVVLVDGVFFSVHKARLKRKTFDTKVEGFHFYDVDFCFQNYLKGAKIGVHTNIKINHRSIGQTNDQWEENRKIFAEKYKENLPVKIKETFEYRKLKILLGCLNFAGNTGSEISTLETAKGLAKLGCKVTVVSANISQRFYMIAKRHGIDVAHIQEPPGYKVGDGEWGMQGPDGVIASKPNTLYKIFEPEFDVIHANHTPITQRLLELYPNHKFVNIVRSEVIDLEDPVIDPRIKKYIAIRPTIKDHLMDNFDIEEDKIDVIYNIFDQTRFKEAPAKQNEKKVILFVGTMDYLRRRPIEDLIETANNEDSIVWLVGKDTDGYAKEFAEQYDNVEYFGETDKIEEYYHKCDQTAGIFLGRTTIEGFLCGKPALIYTVDKTGDVTNKEFQEVPEDMSIFNPDEIIKQLKETYVEAYNEL